MSHTFEILYLGPEYTFSHEAAKLFVEKLRDGGFIDEKETIKIELTPKNNQKLIESSLINNSDAFAVIPICNSVVGDVYKFLSFCQFETIDTFSLPVSFCLCSHSALTEITEITTIKVAYAQVKNAVREMIQNSDEIFVASESTAAAALRATTTKGVAAICSKEAAEFYKLPIIKCGLEGEKKNETTFQVFRNTANIYFSPPLEIASSFHYLTRGAAFYSGKHKRAGNELFVELLNSKKQLHIKWGVDPLQKTLHLGHLANLLKLKDFLAAGHKVTIVLGNFTGIIGDPSGNLSQRPHVNADNLDKNSECIEKEINFVLSGYDYQIIYNDSLIKDFDLRKFLKWMRNIDVRSLLDRLDFKKRLNFDYKLSTAEFIYPLFQAFDTAYIQPDIEIGGIDQIWNTLLIKDIMQSEGLKVPLIMLINEIKGIDLADKMSTFSKNALHLSDSKDKVRNAILNMNAQLMHDYFIGLTRVNMEEINSIQSAIFNNDKNDLIRIKEKLAFEINKYMINP